MMVSHHVPSWPDVPVRFESLNDDTLGLILKFVGDKSYRSFGGTNKRCKEVYIASGMEKKTFIFGYAPLSIIQGRLKNWKMHQGLGKGVVLFNRRDVLDWALRERKDRVLNGICQVAGKEGRLNILKEVSNKVEDENPKRYVFHFVDRKAARGGKLNVLKWFEMKEFDIDKDWCAGEAAEYGHIHILEWLREEQDLELSGYLYNWANNGGGQLYVMKWLREQEVDWYESTFECAAYKGNLNILQWLHDEGCPWPEDELVREEDLKPEALEWLRTNGYRDRIFLRR